VRNGTQRREVSFSTMRDCCPEDWQRSPASLRVRGLTIAYIARYLMFLDDLTDVAV
jgi:hypothetical protein